MGECHPAGPGLGDGDNVQWIYCKHSNYTTARQAGCCLRLDEQGMLQIRSGNHCTAGVRERGRFQSGILALSSALRHSLSEELVP